MKWPTLSPQKKLYSFCGLMLIVVAILAFDHIKLREETARLKRQLVLAARMAADTPDIPDNLERSVKNFDFEIDAAKYRLDDVERRLGYLEISASGLDDRIKDVADSPGVTISQLNLEIQSLKVITLHRHAECISEIMGKLGMPKPWGL